MPTYELALMLRPLTRPELITSITRISKAILNKNGFLRQIDNLGEHKLPFKISKDSQTHHNGLAWIITFDAPPKCITDLKEEYSRDVDILRQGFFKAETPINFGCTLDNELKPPAYRNEVIQLMKEAAKGQKEKYPQKTGLKYYPFQK